MRCLHLPSRYGMQVCLLERVVFAMDWPGAAKCRCRRCTAIYVARREGPGNGSDFLAAPPRRPEALRVSASRRCRLLRRAKWPKIWLRPLKAAGGVQQLSDFESHSAATTTIGQLVSQRYGAGFEHARRQGATADSDT